MTMTPLVTVYIPTRNRRALVGRAIRSVLAQDHRALEIIVVNDASTDDTRAYLDDLAKQDDRVRVVHMEAPGGAPAARNRAIAMARGMFTTGLDDDDEFNPARISKLVLAWERQSATDVPACLFTQTLSVHGSMTVTTSGQARTVGFHDLFFRNQIGNQVFAPTANFRAVGGFDEAMPAWQDLDLFIRMLQRFGSARLVDGATYIAHITVGLERISGDPMRVRRAFARVSAKYPDLPPRYHHALFLQMFSPHYGTIPKLEDFRWLFEQRAIAEMVTLLRMGGLNARRKARAAVFPRPSLAEH